MNNKYLVRIVKNELYCFKNVEYGEVRYMNYGAVEKNAQIENNDVVGIYGQNGSGKTALVEALDILKYILSGREIPYEHYEGLLDPKEGAKLITSFFIEHENEKYKVNYEVTCKADYSEKKINLISEKLIYWRRGVTWKSKRDIYFSNPYYEADSILSNNPVELLSNHAKELKNIEFLKGIQNLAVYCAQRRISIFFNNLILNKISEVKAERDTEEYILANIIHGLLNFGCLFFQVVKVNQLGAINRNDILPVNMHSKTENFVMQGCLPLVMNGQGKISKTVYEQLETAIKSINIALKSIIPNLSIELHPVCEELDKDGEKMVMVDVYSVRDNNKFLTKYESEGIKRIISLLNYLISLYNYPEICLVVDELDSGIFEYLLGELLGVLNAEAKGQLIFTSHNLRAFEKLNVKNIVCSTTNPKNRYIRLIGVEKNHNPRDFYIRTITIGGQKETLYDEADLQTIGYAFRKACKTNENVKIHFSDKFREKLNTKKEN